MANTPVQCQNCGAKYQIPDSFTGASAKCKKCGNVIDVAGARASTSAPAAAQPAGGGTRRKRSTSPAAATSRRSTRDADSQEAAGTRRSRRTAAGSGNRRSRRGDDQEDDADTGGRRGYQSKQGNNTALISIVAGAALIIVSVIAWQMMGQNETPNTDPAAENTGAQKPAKQPDSAKPEEGEQGSKTAEGDTKKGDAGSGKEASGEGKAQPAEATAKKGTAKQGTAKKSTKKKKPKRTTRATVVKPSSEIKAMEDIFVPAKVLKPLPIDKEFEAEFAKYKEQLDEVLTGMASPTVKNKLMPAGYRIVPILVNKLVALDYSDSDQNMAAYEIGIVLKDITGWNFGFTMVRGELTPVDAHENAGRVYDAHLLARRFFTSEAGVKKYESQYKDKNVRR